LNLAEADEKTEMGYDTGEWTERWTEKGDTLQSELKGKYWRMWRSKNRQWKIMGMC